MGFGQSFCGAFSSNRKHQQDVQQGFGLSENPSFYKKHILLRFFHLWIDEKTLSRISVGSVFQSGFSDRQ